MLKANEKFSKQGMNEQDRDLGSRDRLRGVSKLIWYPAEVDVSISSVLNTPTSFPLAIVFGFQSEYSNHLCGNMYDNHPLSHFLYHDRLETE